MGARCIEVDEFHIECVRMGSWNQHVPSRAGFRGEHLSLLLVQLTTILHDALHRPVYVGSLSGRLWQRRRRPLLGVEHLLVRNNLALLDNWDTGIQRLQCNRSGPRPRAVLDPDELRVRSSR